jgi:hypothetical protein
MPGELHLFDFEDCVAKIKDRLSRSGLDADFCDAAATVPRINSRVSSFGPLTAIDEG